MLIDGIKYRNGAMLDGAMQAYFPSYSTLSILSLTAFVSQIVLKILKPHILPSILTTAWAAYLVMLLVYPLFGLILERAPYQAYLVILSGPIFILWRTWLAVTTRFTKRNLDANPSWGETMSKSTGKSPNYLFGFSPLAA